jgi:hypothetical protein
MSVPEKRNGFSHEVQNRNTLTGRSSSFDWISFGHPVGTEICRQVEHSETFETQFLQKAIRAADSGNSSLGSSRNKSRSLPCGVAPEQPFAVRRHPPAYSQVRRTEHDDVLGRVSWRMRHLDRYVAEIQNVTLGHSTKGIPGAGAFVKNILRPCALGEFASAGEMIGMQMCIDHIADLKTALFCSPQIEFNVMNGVAHGALGFAASAKHVRSGDDGMVVQELTKNHL